MYLNVLCIDGVLGSDSENIMVNLFQNEAPESRRKYHPKYD